VALPTVRVLVFCFPAAPGMGTMRKSSLLIVGFAIAFISVSARSEEDEFSGMAAALTIYNVTASVCHFQIHPNLLAETTCFSLLLGKKEFEKGTKRGEEMVTTIIRADGVKKTCEFFTDMNAVTSKQLDSHFCTAHK
jgi:hypothetical protein